ncbi:MAG: heat-inducible transcription repressor HrcA [Candidatus Omnitrophica bacterium]|nr:heat-inducible transcription repressor HrcA [Candidatus Omnitrophota bacterium]
MKVDVEARREKILRIVINTYVSTGNPVSSRTVCTKHKLGLCPASVRNVMSDLEEQGLITHLHTSAGRIPTDKGYRFFVDKLLEYSGLTVQEQNSISNEFAARQQIVEELIRKTSRILSEFTHCAGVVSQPQINRSRFKRMQFTPLSQKKICVTLITNTGLTKNSVIKLDAKIDAERLKRIQNFMNEQFEGELLIQVKTRLRRMMIEERDAFFHILKQAVDLIDLSALIDEKMRFYLEGLSNILELPEFEDLHMMRALMKFFEEKLSLEALVKQVIDDDSGQNKVRVFIGEENEEFSMSDCALILTKYNVDAEPVGVVGIIGSKRMDYGKSIATVQYVADVISEVLSDINV